IPTKGVEGQFASTAAKIKLEKAAGGKRAVVAYGSAVY
ncbi:hypothetical protein PoMZ_12870, partial [Pyricularia oryzae]